MGKPPRGDYPFSIGQDRNSLNPTTPEHVIQGSCEVWVVFLAADLEGGVGEQLVVQPIFSHTTQQVGGSLLNIFDGGHLHGATPRARILVEISSSRP